MVELYDEYRFRLKIPISHSDYLDEDAEFVAWVLKFERMDAEVETELINRR